VLTIGNIIEAGADIGGMAAALNLVIRIPIGVIVVIVGLLILALQIRGSYTFIRNVFLVLSLALLAYIGSAVLAHREIRPVLRGTLIPTVHFNKDFLAMIVAAIGTSLSAYIYTWQSNEEVEEKIAAGRRRLWERRGASRAELNQTMWDIVFGMFFANAVMYFIILSTGATLFKAGKTDINSAADAAQALRPLADNAAGLLFTLGVIGVGFLAVPVMTTGAAHDLCQSTGWKNGLYRKPAEAKKFYVVIAIFTFIAMGLNFFGINPMRALVLAGIVQGFSTPPLMLLIMRMTNNPAIMGKRVNGRAINILGWITTIAIFAASVGLVISWFG
jgi:Mn2+/Fe2+ NRAMP family transporter